VSSTKPIIFISYAHADEPERPLASPALRNLGAKLHHLISPAGLVEPSPPPPAPPDAAAATALQDEARKQLDVARKLIAECGYHRRDEERAELDAVVADARPLADLPPRV
jgi:hypothetical protein